jgi:hypothetical protein
MTLAALVSLHQTCRMIHEYGFTTTYAYYSKNLRKPSDRCSEALTRYALAGFLRAENFISLSDAPNDCLPRSLALFRFLRTLNLPCSHHIGCRRYPSLTMHAWVEVAGEVVLDDLKSPDFERITSIE